MKKIYVTALHETLETRFIIKGIPIFAIKKVIDELERDMKGSQDEYPVELDAWVREDGRIEVQYDCQFLYTEPEEIHRKIVVRLKRILGHERVYSRVFENYVSLGEAVFGDDFYGGIALTEEEREILSF